MCYARRQRSSWARIKLSKSLYQNTVSRDLISLLSSLALSFFYFCWVVFSSVRIFRDPFQAVRFVLLSCCSIFNDQFCPAFARPCYYTTSSCVCQPLFSTFFKKFFGLVRASLCAISLALLAVSLHIILHTMSFCQELFLLFSPFFTFSALQTVFIRHFVRLFGRLVCNCNKRFGEVSKSAIEISLL